MQPQACIYIRPTFCTGKCGRLTKDLRSIELLFSATGNLQPLRLSGDGLFFFEVSEADFGEARCWTFVAAEEGTSTVQCASSPMLAAEAP